MLLVQQELNRPKEVRLETRPGYDRKRLLKGCVYIPKDDAVQVEILWTNRDKPQGEHFKNAFGMMKDIKDYVKTWDIC